MNRFRKVIVAAVLVTTSALLLYGLFGWQMPAPQVTYVSLKGERITPDELKGKVLLVNFWATDCEICVKEMPEMVRTYERHRGLGLEFIAVAMKHDPPNHVIQYAEKNRLPFKVVLDPLGELAKAYGDVRLTPTSFVIDRRGRIVWRIQGEPDFAKLNALLEEKLKEPA